MIESLGPTETNHVYFNVLIYVHPCRFPIMPNSNKYSFLGMVI